MSSNSDPFLDTRLLARRNTVSVQEKEYVLEAVLLHTHRAEKSRIGALLFSPGPTRRALAALLAVLLLIPAGYFLFRGAPISDDEFRMKGVGTTAPFFRVSCFDSVGKTKCRPGGKLAFQLRRKQKNLYFAAFARRASDGLIYWYFPSSETEKSVPLKDLGGDGILSYGMRIDDTYSPGRYEVFGVLSNTPLDRQEIREYAFGDRNSVRESPDISTVFFTVER